MDQQVRLHNRRRTGQTLAEFAITLPILLLLLFGIIEFGRIFQAWVTLQNSARAAARYATTGVYNTDKYKLDLNVYDSSDTTWHGDLDSIVPCLKNEEIQDNPTGDPVIDGDNALAKTHNLAQRGVSVTYNTTTSGFNTLDPVQAFQDGPESIYATYYSGDDCDPTDPDDQNRRKDLARILSVYDEARIGAAGLALGQYQMLAPQRGLPAGWTEDPSTWSTLPAYGHYPDPSTVPWYQVWDRPLPGASVFDQLRHSDEKGYFDVTICSTRTKLQDMDAPNPEKTDNRFIFPTILRTAEDTRAPVCLLQETTDNTTDAGRQLITDGWTANPDRPWWDAGGPGDTVSIVVSFNHPLITPLGLASYLPLQARRVAVNEAFRAPRAVPPSYSLPEPPTLIPTNTYTPTVAGTLTPTPTSTDTETSTSTATNTLTSTPEFACSSLTTGTVTYRTDRIDITLTNSLPYDIYLNRASLTWAAPSLYPSMRASAMFLTFNAIVQPIWAGAVGPTVTDVGTSGANGPFGFAQYNRNLVLAPGITTWTMQFLNGPPDVNVMPLISFNGTKFYYNVLNGMNDCVNTLNFGTATPTTLPPTNTTPTNTATIECVGNHIKVSAAKFDMGDVMRFDILNLYSIPINVTAFSINWAQRGPTTFKLINVYGGGSGSTLSIDSVPIWGSSAGGITTSPTVGAGPNSTGMTGAQPTWLNDFSIPPGRSMPIYVQFSGGSPLHTLYEDSGYQIVAEDFYGTYFRFNAPSCGIIETEQPASTLAPTPTNSPTATATNTPIPPTSTPTATDTATNTATPTTTPITLALAAACNTVGVVTGTISNGGNPLPIGTVFTYQLYHGSTPIGSPSTYTTTAAIPPSLPLSLSTGGYYGADITFRITAVTLQARYALTNSLPIISVLVTCIQPTATNTPTNTPTRTPTNTNTPVTPTATPTVTPITVTLSASCNTTGTVTGKIDNSGTNIPVGTVFTYQLYHGSTAIGSPTSYTTTAAIGSALNRSLSTGGYYGNDITFRITNIVLPAHYSLTNSLPMISANVTCTQPTATPTKTPITPTNTKTNTPIPPTSTPTSTPIPTTINFTLTCDNVGNVTATITSSPSLPAGGSVSYILRTSGGSDISGSSGSINTPLPRTATSNSSGNYGTITFRITGVTMPAGYTLSTGMPLDKTVNCTQPTPTNTNTPVTPTNTPTKTPVTPTATNTPVTPTATNTPVTPTATKTNTPVAPTATATATKIPVTVAVSASCAVVNGENIVTGHITFSPSLPSNATVSYVLIKVGVGNLAGTSGSASVSSTKDVLVNIGGNFGPIVFRITAVGLPAGYSLTTAMPLNSNQTICDDPTVIVGGGT